jgi:hypothetical protein
VSLTTTATDAAGNTSVASAARTLTVDTAAPAVSVVGSVSDNVGATQGALSNGASTDDTTLTLAGTAEAGATVKLFNGATQVGSATAVAFDRLDNSVGGCQGGDALPPDPRWLASPVSGPWRQIGRKIVAHCVCREAEKSLVRFGPEYEKWHERQVARFGRALQARMTP